MKRFLAILLSMMLLAGTAEAYTLPGLTEDSEEEVTFIIEVEGEPALVASDLKNEYELEEATNEILDNQAKVMSEIKGEISKRAEKGFVYTALFNGFSLEGKKSDLEELKSLDGVKNVYISQKTPVYEPMLDNAGELSEVESAYESEYSGKGQVIAVVDSFCDTSHEFFEAAPEEPKYSKADIDNILKTKTLNSGAVSANQVYKSAKIPYAFNYANASADTFSDTHYHGTHVSGIAAGKNGTLPDGTKFSGVAYDAQILFMSASDGRYLYDEMIFAAINDAALLGTDVINLSFGSAYTDSANGDAYETIFDNARKQGISIVASAGNSSRGYNDVTPLVENVDYSSVGTPAGIDSITAAASAYNTKMDVYYWNMSLKDGSKMNFYFAYDSSNFDKLVKDSYTEYEYCGIGATADFANKNLTGKIALVDRGEINFTEKSDNAKNAGAAGIIIANTSDSILSIAELSLPAATVTKTDGKKLSEASEKQIKLIDIQKYTVPLESSGEISYYSSWGVDSSLRLKPEITAPGGNVYSSMPDNEYGYLSGTSMASPYVAGIYALTRQYYETNPYIDEYNGISGSELVDLIENISMSSAKIVRSSNGIPYSPRVQGAGMINVKNILNNKVLITGDSGKAKLSLGEIGDSFDVSFTITNISNETVELENNSVELIADGSFKMGEKNYVGSSVRVEADIDLMPEKITINSGESYTFSVKVTPDKEFLEENKKIFTNGFFIDGFVELGGTNGYSVPFTGFYGDWYSVPIFDRTTYDKGGSVLADSDNPYSTGTYLKAYDEEGYYHYIGRNGVDTSIADEKYISFSNKSDLTLALSFRNHRTTSGMTFAILDNNNYVKYAQSGSGIFNKYTSYNYKFNSASMSALDEGEYTLCVFAKANGSSKNNDYLELPLVIDNTAPQLISASYDPVSKTVTVTAKDNHYLAYFYLYTKADDVQYTAITDKDMAADGTVKKEIDVSAFSNPEDIIVGVSDYAMNSEADTLEMLSGFVGVVPKKISTADGATQAEFLVRNNTKSDMTSDVTVAFYDENLELIAVSVKEDCAIKSGETVPVSYSISADIKDAAMVKVFVWEQNTLIPIDKAKIFELN